MFDIIITYIILSLGVDENGKYQYYIMYNTENTLPSVVINSTDSIISARSRCIKESTGLELMWLDDKLIDLEIIDKKLSIFYTCSLPIETKINGKFIPVTTEHTTSSIVQKAINRT